MHEKRPPSPQQHGNRSAGRLRVIQRSTEQKGRREGSSCPGLHQAQQSGAEKCYLRCQARDELCATAESYLMEMSRNSSRFKSRHQEMDNASYLDMPQTTAGMHPPARREQAGSSRARCKHSCLQRQLCSPKKPKPFPRGGPTGPIWLLTEPKPAVIAGHSAAPPKWVKADA